MRKIKELKQQTDMDKKELKIAKGDNKVLMTAMKAKRKQKAVVSLLDEGEASERDKKLVKALARARSEQERHPPVQNEREKPTIEDKFALVTIEFEPPEKIAMSDSVAILGEFNHWLPEVMHRYTSQEIQSDSSLANRFYYKTHVLKGFGYRYHFSVGDNFLVDSTKESSENAFGHLTNKIYAPVDEEEEIDLPQIMLTKKPTYNAAVMNELIPEELRVKQGQRVYSDVDAGDLIDYLVRHDSLQDECTELEQLAQEAELLDNMQALNQIQTAMMSRRNELEKAVNVIKVHLVGRLVRPITMRDDERLLHEVQQFNEGDKSLKLRQLFDQNGILFSKENQPHSKIFKHVRGVLLEKHYEIVERMEEYNIRKNKLAKAKLTIKFKKQEIDG